MLEQHSNRQFSKEHLQTAVQQFEEGFNKVNFLLDMLEEEGGQADRKERRLVGEIRSLSELKKVLGR